MRISIPSLLFNLSLQCAHHLLTEAEAISDYSILFRRSEGLYLTFPCADRMEEDYLAQTSNRDIELVGESFMLPQVVTCGIDGLS